ncbi:MAG: YwbE family protein [Cytophagaceae bacterium]
MKHQYRKNIKPGMEVEVILKKDQATGIVTSGIVKAILTSSLFHSRGIKVKLDDGQVGRVQKILTDEIGNPLD